jgi:hypothetical protein
VVRVAEVGTPQRGHTSNLVFSIVLLRVVGFWIREIFAMRKVAIVAAPLAIGKPHSDVLQASHISCVASLNGNAGAAVWL